MNTDLDDQLDSGEDLLLVAAAAAAGIAAIAAALVVTQKRRALSMRLKQYFPPGNAESQVQGLLYFLWWFPLLINSHDFLCILGRERDTLST